MHVRLKVLSGKSAGKLIHVPYEEFLIGRSDACHLRPKSDAISRKHCRILVASDAVFVEDLGSRNGTFINGERVTQKRAVQSGDHLRIGKLEFEFLIEAAAPAAQPVTAGPVEMKEDTWVEDDITRWLEEAAVDNGDSSKQLRLDPVERSMVDTALNRAPTESTVVTTTAGLESPQATPSASSPEAPKTPEKAESKKPGKLPVRPTIQAANSGEAAAQMLKKFFTRP
jgi:pSer/pThr/pTyr-binding forkhead associated (FHA) protein